MEIIKVSNETQFRNEIRRLMADNFTVQRKDKYGAVLSRKKSLIGF